MEYYTKPDKIIITDLSQFNIEHILDCGQVFRYRKAGDHYTLFAKNANCHLRAENDYVIINTNFVDFFIDYFDLNADYTAIKEGLKKYSAMESALDFGSGIRLLNQDPVEMIISFIISANNNIPRIKGIIERLCENLGEDMGGYHAFPTVDALSGANEKFYFSIGAGYRARYLAETSKALQNFDTESLRAMDTSCARRKLLTLSGIGPKVADCILLFAYKKTDLFPMDTWSKKIYRILGYERDTNISAMSGKLVDKFGSLSGYAQQYLYYYYRTIKNI